MMLYICRALLDAIYRYISRAATASISVAPIASRWRFEFAAVDRFRAARTLLPPRDELGRGRIAI